MRERELELEIARLNAEIETLRGEAQPTDSAARFLAMAANTVDLAMEDARREADELAAEVSAEAEARRDAATRIAEEAEVRAEALRQEVDQSQIVVRKAALDADQIRTAAKQEAAELVTAERTRLADELEVLSGVRVALEEERGALESYHEELQRRVHELAESMVAFMTTEPPIGAVQAIDDRNAPTLGSTDGLSTESAHAEETPMRGDPFGRATDSEQEGSTALFGAHGAPLIQAMSPQLLAAALADDGREDEHVRVFNDGDEAADASRDWLLRSDQY